MTLQIVLGGLPDDADTQHYHFMAMAVVQNDKIAWLDGEIVFLTEYFTGIDSDIAWVDPKWIRSYLINI